MKKIKKISLSDFDNENCKLDNTGSILGGTDPYLETSGSYWKITSGWFLDSYDHVEYGDSISQC
jgi:hypothetical protein